MTDKLSKIWENFDYLTAIVVLGIIIVSVLLSRLSRYLIARYLRKLSKAEDYSFDDATRLQFLRNAINLLIFTVAGLSITYTIPPLRSIAVTLFASAGILAAFVGFASQNAFANIVSGIFIVWFKPFRVGDFVQVGEHKGTVEDVTLRHTVIRNLESRRVIIPNSIISKETILNSTITDLVTCRFVDVRIDYEADLDKAMHLLGELAEAHPDTLDKRSEADKADGEPKVMVRVIELGDAGVLLRAYVWAMDSATAFAIGTDLNYQLKKRFDQEGISWGYPHRILINRKKTE